MLLYNGNILTMEGKDLGRIPYGWIRIEGKKIQSLGDMGSLEKLPNEPEKDLKGALVLPGFIDAHTHIGLCGDGIGMEGEDYNEDTDPITPHLRAIDAINPMEKSFAEALSSGVTTVAASPGSANPIGGQICAVKTSGLRVDKICFGESIGVKFALGENPKASYNLKEQPPVTRMATAALIREALRKAEEYADALQKSEDDEECDAPDYDAKCEALLPLLQREKKAHFHCHRADDIFTAIRIAKEFSLDYVLVHCTEGHLIADELREEGAEVITGPLFGARGKPELSLFTAKTPGVLAKEGVSVAVCTDHPEVVQQYLALSAGLAVSEGMDYAQALQAITIVPARICGLDKRIGSLKAGKDADFLIYHSDPFSLGSRPAEVWVDGVQKR
jgi:imidazolonepropionase-like amidohydrolase